MNSFIILLFLLFNFVFLQNKNPPIWPNTFYAEYMRSDVKTQWKTIWNYDATLNASRTDYLSGQEDFICYSQKKTHDSCSHIVTNYARYLFFPKTEECCLCCYSDTGCGIIAPDWLKGGSYVGEKVFNQTVCEGWQKNGNQENFWYQTEKGIPCYLKVNSQTWTFNMSTYKSGSHSVNPKVFELPNSSCKNRCTSAFCHQI